MHGPDWPHGPHGGTELEVGAAALVDLVDAAVSAGASLPRALEVVGRSVGGEVGRALVRAGAALLLGASWPQAWNGAPEDVAEVAAGLELSWVAGAAPGPSLRARAAAIRRRQRMEAREAAARLAVRLVLPLGVCLLPAFVLLGLVPVVISLVEATVG